MKNVLKAFAVLLTAYFVQGAVLPNRVRQFNPKCHIYFCAGKLVTLQDGTCRCDEKAPKEVENNGGFTPNVPSFNFGDFSGGFNNDGSGAGRGSGEGTGKGGGKGVGGGGTGNGGGGGGGGGDGGTIANDGGFQGKGSGSGEGKGKFEIIVCLYLRKCWNP